MKNHVETATVKRVIKSKRMMNKQAKTQTQN